MNSRLLALLGAFAAAPAMASPVSPISYDMLNGNTGSYVYHDDSYTGLGDVTVDNSALSGGLGDLTDGIIANDNWYVTEAPPGPGPYLGWTLDPVITFHFAQAYKFASVTFYFDDANGIGGVSAPAGVDVNGVSAAIADPVGLAPFSYTLDLSSLSPTNLLTVTINRSNAWVFLSEVSFTDISTVPVPAGLPLLAAGIGALGLMRRRKV